MHRIFLLLACLFISAQAATPCNNLPSSYTQIPLGGWVAEIGDNLYKVCIALGIRDINIIPALNPQISSPDEILAGSSYCVPYTS